MATCTVTLTGNTAAISDAVKFEPLPNQIIDGVAIDTSLITATISGTAYSAALIQRASYRLVSSKFYFSMPIFTCPATGTADLEDLISGYRAA